MTQNPSPQISNPNQCFTAHAVMVRPYRFYCNEQTVQDNMYQSSSMGNQHQQTNQKAIQQFDNFVHTLRQHGITVTVVQDTGKNPTPDSIFPNNWISFHQPDQVIVYPMYAENRRLERELPLVQQVEKTLEKKLTVIKDYSEYEKKGVFLQGTGSMVLDRENRIVYAVLSQRTSVQLLQIFCKDMNYKLCAFRASQYSQQKKSSVPIYHTNVLMSVSRHFVMISLQLISNQQQRQQVKSTILQTNKQLILLSSQQIKNFAGNTLTLVSNKGEDLMIMSQRAYKCLSLEQIGQIEKYVKIVYCDLQTIEVNGGGSARCMLAEVF